MWVALFVKKTEVAFNPQEAYQLLYDKVIEKMIVPAT